MAITKKKAEAAPKSKALEPEDVQKPPAPETKVEEAPSAAQTPQRTGGLAGLVAMHVGEAPKHDAQLEAPRRGPGRPASNMTDEERKAARNARDRERRGLNAPEKKKEVKPEYTPEQKKNKLEVASKALTASMIGLCTGFFGEKFKDGATGNDDKEILQSGWYAYLEAKEWYDLPPALALGLAFAAYFAPRINFKALWDKMFKPKGKVYDEKPTDSAKQSGGQIQGAAQKPGENAVPFQRAGNPADVLVYKPAPVGPAEGGSGAPGA